MPSVASMIETREKTRSLVIEAMGSKDAGVRVHVRVGLVGSNALRCTFKGYAARVQANSCV